MSNSVAEFFSKKGVKKFKNGIKAFAESQAVKVVAASMVLATAFASASFGQTAEPRDSVKAVTAYAIMEKGDTLCSYQAIRGDSASFARLEKLVNNATKSQTGREVLQNVSKQGTTLYVDYAGQGMVGFFDPGSNSICLNPVYSDGNLQSCLVHEGKHSVQSAALNKDADCYYDFASNVMSSRVMEADAVATQTKFSYEMAQAGDSIAWKTLASDHPLITSAFENGVKTHGQNSEKTMKETMLAWYQDKDYAKLYDKSLVDFHARIVIAAPEDMAEKCFKQTMSADTLVKYVCTMGGKPYAGTDGSILKTPETAYLAPDVYEDASLVGRVAEIRTGKKDTSMDAFYVLETDGSVSKKTYAQVNEEKAKEENKAKEGQKTESGARQGQSPAQQKPAAFFVASAKESFRR